MAPSQHEPVRALTFLLLGLGALDLSGCGRDATTNAQQMTTLQRVHLNLYVADQDRSRRFYARVLGLDPSLNVPGMTEFVLPGGTILGLAPESEIDRLFGPNMPSPSLARGVPRAELYVVVSDPAAYHARALASGAKEISPLLPRDWGHLAAYSLDHDGHVLAFAKPSPADR